MSVSESKLRKRAKSAVQSLQSAVDSLQQNYERLCAKRPNLPRTSEQHLSKIRDIMKHIQVWLTALLLKQASLSIAMECLVETTWPSICNALEEELRQRQRQLRPQDTDKNIMVQRVCQLLQHLFTQLIRLHDGLILCISGECRHKGDIRAARRNKLYPSRLNQQGASSDGVTQLYSSNLHYSGESWDEYHDPKCGIQRELVTLLERLVPKSQRASLWDTLIEKGAMPMEAVLDELQNQREKIQSDCTSLKNRINSELKLLLQRYGSNILVDLRLPDKMEKFYVKIDALEWKFERFANTFQVKDPAGALPLLFEKEEWKRLLMPSVLDDERQEAINKKKKRRAILDDSDSDADDEAPKKPLAPAAAKRVDAMASGLVVKVQQAKPIGKAVEDDPASVEEIKRQMGVNVDQLAESRQHLEEEEAAARRAADAVDDAPEDMTDLQSSMLQVKQLDRVLKKASLALKPNDYIWNAQECLREACMNAGNCCLDEAVDDPNAVDHLETAIAYFDRAHDLCLDQQELLTKMVVYSEEPDFSYKSISHRYMLLLCRAQTNSGIARADLAQQLSGRDYKLYDREAKKLLMSALETAKSLIADLKQHGTTVEAIVDLMNTRELGILVRMRLGKLFMFRWQQLATTSSLKLSVDCFHSAETFMSEVDPMDMMFADELFDATLKALVQEYNASATFADLAVAVLENIQGSAIRDRVEELDYISEEAMKAIEAAACKSERLYNLAAVSQDAVAKELFLKEQGLLLATDLRQIRSNLAGDWKRKREIFTSPLLESTNQNPDIGRSDVPLSDLAPARPFGGRIVLGRASGKKKKKKHPSAYSNFGVSKRSTENTAIAIDESPEPTQRRYRKWGDELLPQIIDEHGRSVPKLEYPAIAPVLPPGLKAQWEENLRRKAALEANNEDAMSVEM